MDMGSKRCFIITPIGNIGSDIYRHINGVIKSAIRPILSEYGFNDVKAAHEICEPGSINTQIITRIAFDDLVIANLTTNNPNVMYELCLRHVVAKPIIHICEVGTSLPFDIKDNRTIFYKNDMLGVADLKADLKDMLETIDYEQEYRDNPIHNAIRLNHLLKIRESDTKNPEMEILQRILYYVSSGEIGNTYFLENTSMDRIRVSLKSKENVKIDEFINSCRQDTRIHAFKIIEKEQRDYIICTIEFTCINWTDINELKLFFADKAREIGIEVGNVRSIHR